ncbi:MAG: hypothetical protein V2A70_04555 [Candidatus Omnitrophota bacterium]
MNIKTSFAGKIMLVFFGLVLSLVLLESGLRLMSSVLGYWHAYHVNLLARKQADIRILCLGESTTRGQYPRFL